MNSARLLTLDMRQADNKNNKTFYSSRDSVIRPIAGTFEAIQLYEGGKSADAPCLIEELRGEVLTLRRCMVWHLSLTSAVYELSLTKSNLLRLT